MAFFYAAAINSHAMYSMHVSKSSGGPRVSWPFGYGRASQAKREIGADAPMFLVLEMGLHYLQRRDFRRLSGFGVKNFAGRFVVVDEEALTRVLGLAWKIKQA
jgi:hypothetical protein